jgi:predicted PurR-regulated permease PerM
MVYTAAALFVVGLAWLLIQVKSIIIILVLGIILASAIDPLVRRLRRYGLSRGQGILVVYLGLAAIVGLMLYLVVPPLVRQAIELVNNIPDILANLRQQAATSNSDFIRTTGVRAIDRASRAYEQYKASPPIETQTAFGFVTTVFGAVFTTFSVLIVAFYWTTEKATIKRLVLGLFPADKRDYAHDVWDEIEAKLGGWTRGEAVLCTVIGTASGIAYWSIGLDFWLALAIVAAFTEAIPFFGPILAGSMAFIIALTDSWQKALLVVVIVFAIQQLEGAVLVPRVMKNAVGLSPLSVIIAIFVGGGLLGPLGAVIAIPVAAAVQVLVQNLLKARADHPEERGATDLLADALGDRPSHLRDEQPDSRGLPSVASGRHE